MSPGLLAAGRNQQPALLPPDTLEIVTQERDWKEFGGYPQNDPNGDYGAVIVSGANLHIDPASLTDAALWVQVAVLLLQNEVPEPLNLAAAQIARAHGIPVILNAAPARALGPDFAALIDVLVVNAVEAEMMGTAVVTDLTSAALAAETLASRFSAVVVTAGSAGLAAWSALDEAFCVSPDPVTVISSHGAGDAFTGTLAAALAQGATLQTACQAASKAAAQHVRHDGWGHGRCPCSELANACAR